MSRINLLVLVAGLVIGGIPSFSQTVTRQFIIQKLSNNSSKEWFKAGTLAKKERMDGDMKYVFSKRTMKFTVYKCNTLLKWIKKEEYVWSIEPEGDLTPTGFHHWVLKVADHYASFRMDPSYKTLYLKLYGMNDQLVLQ